MPSRKGNKVYRADEKTSYFWQSYVLVQLPAAVAKLGIEVQTPTPGIGLQRYWSKVGVGQARVLTSAGVGGRVAENL